MKRKLTAADAIAKAKASERYAPPTKEALVELRAICKHNDDQISSNKRVSWREALRVLHSHGWHGKSIRTLDKLCQEHLGRKGYAKP